jgi:hypothetical protein
LGFEGGAGADPVVAPDFGQIGQAETRAPLGSLELSTGKCLYLQTWCPKSKENTRCCGFVLTYTTESGTFSSAALNGL